MKYYCFILTVFLMAMANVMANPNGAPTSACQTMVPAHGYQPQIGRSPFIVTLLMGDIMQNTFLPLALASISADVFKGFLLMAFKPGSNMPIGTFSVQGDSILINCVGNANSSSTRNAVTHSSNDGKRLVAVIWKPPYNFVGQVQFRATFVKNVQTYWVDVTSDVVNVIDISSYPTSSNPPISCTLLLIVFLSTITSLFSIDF